MNVITPEDVKRFFKKADEDQIQDLLDHGLRELIEELEEEDFFGTEGFEKRFA